MTKNKSPLHFLSLLEAADLIRTRQLSPTEITKDIFSRISTLDSEFHSFTYLMQESARRSAELAEKEIQAGRYLGPLHGIPIGVKDLCYTQGIPTRGGLHVLKDFVPKYDATVISKLKAASAVIIGKLSLTEGAVGGYHRNYPLPRNPWGQDLWPGGSSSGSGIATAAGFCYGSLGSDTGGSIRFPSMACGIVGLKPTYGRVSRHGILPLAESMDHVGPMTRTVADAAIMFECIAGYDSADSTSSTQPVPDMLVEIEKPITGLRIGYDPLYASSNTDPELVVSIEMVLQQLQELGAQLVEVTMPDISSIREQWQIICTHEAAKAHEKYFPEKASSYGDFFRDFLEIGYHTSDLLYRQANKDRNSFNEQLHQVMSDIDALACPGGGVPFKIPPNLLYGSMKEIRSFMADYTYFQFTIPGNFSGLPSLCFPCGISEKSVPYSMQLMGNKFSEAVLCRLGHAYQKVTNWHNYHPDL